MAVHQIDLGEAKQHLIDLINIALTGEEIVITEADKPVLRIARIPEPKPHRKRGSAKGLIEMSEDFDAPLDDFREYM